MLNDCQGALRYENIGVFVVCAHGCWHCSEERVLTVIIELYKCELQNHNSRLVVMRGYVMPNTDSNQPDGYYGDNDDDNIDPEEIDLSFLDDEDDKPKTEAPKTK